MEQTKQINPRLVFSNSYLLSLFLPLVIEQFLEYLVGLADSVMVAHVGESAVSGVSLVDFVMTLLISIFAALATGGAVIAGQYLGKQQQEKAREAANQLVWFSGIISLVIMALVYFGKDIILSYVFGKIPAEVYRDADLYMMITAASIPFLAIYSAGAAIFRTMGNSKLPMQIMLGMNILHAIGNAILIYGFHTGVEGVAIPTLLTRIFAAVLIIALALNRNQSLYLKRSLKYKTDWAMLKKILGIGLPYGLENGLFYLGRIVVLSLVASFGTAAIAANAVAGTINMFQVLPGISIGLGLTVVISRCVGAGDFEMARYYTRKIVRIVYVAHLISSLVVIALLPGIMHLYGLSEAATLLTKKIVWSHGLVMILIWPLAYTLPITFRASGDAKFPMAVGSLTMIFCRIVLAYFISIQLQVGMFGTWIAMYIDWIVKAVFFVIRYLGQRWTTFRSV